MTFANSPAYFQRTVMIALLIAEVLSVCELLLCVKRKAKASYVITETVVTLASGFILICLLSYVKAEAGSVPRISVLTANVSSWLYLAVANLFIATSVAIVVLCYKMQKSRISDMSIKESFDNLPSGICFCDRDGLPRLVNVKINELCEKITGKPLVNASEFWDVVAGDAASDFFERIRYGEKPMIKTDDGKVYSFKRVEHVISGKSVYEIVATDVTRRYGLSVEFANKNKEREAFNRRLREYGENIEELIAEKETLDAKIRIHDELGKLLLMTRKSLCGEMSGEEKRRLLAVWQNDLIAFGSTKENVFFDTYGGLYRAAKSVGVTIEITGEKPKDKKLKRIVVTAAIECITNAVKHAKGNVVWVELCDNGAFLQVEITNNGEPPKEKIVEGGGFSSLRLFVEREGGSMSITSKPAFKLTITLIKGESR